MLTRFSDNEWSPGDRQAPGDQRAIGDLPPITGLSGNVPTKEYDYEVEIGQNFDSPWLPTQFPVSRIEAVGDWRYDSSTMDVMSFDPDLRAGGMTYGMTAVVPSLDAVDMSESSVATDLADTQLTDLPTSLSTSVRTLATRVTAEAPTRFRKAVALQNYFRDNGTYTLAGPVGHLDRHPRGVPRRGRRRAAHRVLRAVRRRDGRDGPQPQHPRPGRHRLPEAQGSGGRELRLQRARPARVARAVLPGLRLGALRAHPV